MHYLYNGEKFPALPEISGYSHKCIYSGTFSSKGLFLSQVPFVMAGNGGGLSVLPSVGTATWKHYTYNEDTDEWEAAGDREYTFPQGWIWGCKWSNQDIYRYDNNGVELGTLYLAASDPVPLLKKGSCSCKPALFPSSGIGGKNTWKKITMNINESLMSSYIWTDGTNIYYSRNGSHYVLNGHTWEPKTWNGYTDFNGGNIWTDGVHIYASGDDAYQYVLDGDTWIVKEWKFEFASAIAHLPSGGNIWTDGNQIYHSNFNGAYQYVLDGDTWKDKNWNISLAGGSIWSDGINVYGHSYSSREPGFYQLINGVWEPKTWNIDPVAGGNIWTDGDNVYLSTGSKHYVLRDGIWYPKTWNGYTGFSGGLVWSDGVSMYTYGYVPGTLQFDSHYVLTGSGPVLNPTAILIGYSMGAKL